MNIHNNVSTICNSLHFKSSVFQYAHLLQNDRPIASILSDIVEQQYNRHYSKRNETRLRRTYGFWKDAPFPFNSITVKRLKVISHHQSCELDQALEWAFSSYLNENPDIQKMVQGTSMDALLSSPELRDKRKHLPFKPSPKKPREDEPISHIPQGNTFVDHLIEFAEENADHYVAYAITITFKPGRDRWLDGGIEKAVATIGSKLNRVLHNHPSEAKGTACRMELAEDYNQGWTNLHLHGIALIPRTLEHKLSKLRAGPEEERYLGRLPEFISSVQLKPIHDLEGWASYAAKHWAKRLYRKEHTALHPYKRNS